MTAQRQPSIEKRLNEQEKALRALGLDVSAMRAKEHGAKSIEQLSAELQRVRQNLIKMDNEFDLSGEDAKQFRDRYNAMAIKEGILSRELNNEELLRLKNKSGQDQKVSDIVKYGISMPAASAGIATLFLKETQKSCFGLLA